MTLTTCDTKAFYDTEFEAEVAKARVEDKFNQEMMIYRCRGAGVRAFHYHLSHVNKEERRGAGHNHWRCPRCKMIIKRAKQAKHRGVCPARYPQLGGKDEDRS